jgi:dTDP-4-dehydrorhamnose reductase
MKILLTGCTGQVGQEIQRRSAAYDFQIVAHSHSTLDISKMEQVASVFEHETIDLVINAAAYTAVDKAESEQDIAFSANSAGIENLALQAKKHDIPVFHISTDYVFDGESTVAYSETSETNPTTVYGASKLDGEQRLSSMLNNHIILRTSWVFGIDGNNFVKTMLRLGDAHKELRVVADQLGNPSFAGSIADALLKMANQYQQEKTLPWGLYHYCNNSATTWHSFAEHITSLGHKYNLIENIPIVKPILTSEFPTEASRPRFSSLDNSHFKATFPQIEIAGWQEALEHVISTLSGENS